MKNYDNMCFRFLDLFKSILNNNTNYIIEIDDLSISNDDKYLTATLNLSMKKGYLSYNIRQYYHNNTFILDIEIYKQIEMNGNFIESTIYNSYRYLIN